MIEHPFLSVLAKIACLGKLQLIFSKNSRATRLADFKSSLAPFHHSTIVTVSSIMFCGHMRSEACKLQQHKCGTHFIYFVCHYNNNNNNRGVVAMVTCMMVDLYYHYSTFNVFPGWFAGKIRMIRIVQSRSWTIFEVKEGSKGQKVRQVDKVLTLSMQVSCVVSSLRQ